MISKTILSKIIYDQDFMRRVIPFLKKEYFEQTTDQIIFKAIREYIDKYNSLPSKEALSLSLSSQQMTDEQEKQVKEQIDAITEPDVDIEWLTDETEKFCKDRAVYLAIMDSIQIMDKKDGDEGQIPGLLSEALGVSFDTHIGHDFFLDAESRFEFYTEREDRIPFDLEYMNKITKGGVPRKTLNMILAGTGVGKSLCMCHMASHNLMDGRNVLYITLEMAEEKIAERIDANILNTSIDELSFLPKKAYEKKVERAFKRTDGKLVIKEYPTAGAHTGHFRHLLNELKLKKSFKPDIIYIDYLNLCMSARMRLGAGQGSYFYIKAIAEELRGLAVEFNVPIFSATQTTRGAFNSSDIGLEDTSESFGLPATADFMFAIISNEELDAFNQFMVKQLKNRYSDPVYNRRFVIGVDKPKMRLYDVEQKAQEDIQDDTPVMDNSATGERMKDLFKDFK
jgi:archaellum biogenesis ATPase FlaH